GGMSKPNQDIFCRIEMQQVGFSRRQWSRRYRSRRLAKKEILHHRKIAYAFFEVRRMTEVLKFTIAVIGRSLYLLQSCPLRQSSEPGRSYKKHYGKDQNGNNDNGNQHNTSFITAGEVSLQKQMPIKRSTPFLFSPQQ